MSASQSVVGFVPDALAKGLHDGKGFAHDVLELPLEAGKQGTHLRVRRNDIHEVRVGPSKAGHTSLQLILKPEATYELVAKAPKEAELLTAIQDPAFLYGLGRLHWFVIYAGPIYRQQNGAFKLVEEQTSRS